MYNLWTRGKHDLKHFARNLGIILGVVLMQKYRTHPPPPPAEIEISPSSMCPIILLAFFFNYHDSVRGKFWCLERKGRYEFHKLWHLRTRIKYYTSYFAFISVVTRERLVTRFDTASFFRERQSTSLASKQCNNSWFTSVTTFTNQHTTANLHAQHGNICNI
jgi:hypothetical protein